VCVISLGVSVIFLVLSLVLCAIDHIAYDVLLTMFYSELWSCVQWFVWTAPWFCYNYGKDRNHFEEKVKRKSARLGLSEIEMV
jgi:hypothetical protein